MSDLPEILREFEQATEAPTNEEQELAMRFLNGL